MFDREEMGRRIRQRREDVEILPWELAEFAGVCVETVYNLERGKYSPRIDTICAIAEALQVSLDWICFGLSRSHD